MSVAIVYETSIALHSRECDSRASRVGPVTYACVRVLLKRYPPSRALGGCKYKALKLDPTIGVPHNQLAILATYGGRYAVAAYRYIRALYSRTPAPKAAENLAKLFTTVVADCTSTGGSSSLSRAPCAQRLSWPWG